MNRWRLIVIGLGCALAGCGATSQALVVPRTPVAAASRSLPQLAMVRLRTANGRGHPLADLILVTLGARHDVVLSAGSRGGRLEPLTGPVAWSPDGRRIAFARITSGELRGTHGYPYLHHDIYIINANGTRLHRLTRTQDAWAPIWSPDGREIAFSREHLSANGASLTGSLWTIRPDGTGLRQLTKAVDGQDDLPSSFSPDGRLLAFTRVVPTPPVGLITNPYGVYLLRLADGSVQTLAPGASDPAFSPNGRSIALTSTRAHNGTQQLGSDSSGYAGELYLVDLNGKHWRRLTYTNGIDESYPSFSPDGARIAYERTDSIQTKNSSDNYHHTVWEMNVDGSCPTRVRDDDRADVFWYFAPTWRPGRSLTGAGPLHCRHHR